jgi:Uma2 family endonuclease
MTGGSAAHAVLIRNLNLALGLRLRGTPCQTLGPDAGVETVNKAIRYPDALVTCSQFRNDDRTIPNVVIVFEVISPTSVRTDRIVKVREYLGVPSIRRYVIVESTTIGLTVMERSEGDEIWRTTVLTEEDMLRMPDIGIEVPVAEIYEGLSFPNTEAASG